MAVAQANPVGLQLVGRARLAGSLRLPADRAPPTASGGFLFVGHHAGEALNPLTGARGAQRSVDPRRHESERAARISRTCRRRAPRPRGTQHVQVCDGSALPERGPTAKVYRDSHQRPVGYEVLDVTDPAKPLVRRRRSPKTGCRRVRVGSRQSARRTSFSGIAQSGIAYLNGTPQGWRVTRLLQAFDLGNPERRRSTSAISALRAMSRRPPGPFPRRRRSRACTSRSSSATACIWATTAATTACCRSSIATGS